MQKSIRSFALIATFVLAIVPAAHANRTGCDPHPQAVTAPAPSGFSVFVYTVRSYFGL